MRCRRSACSASSEKSRMTSRQERRNQSPRTTPPRADRTEERLIAKDRQRSILRAVDMTLGQRGLTAVDHRQRGTPAVACDGQSSARAVGADDVVLRRSRR